MPQYPRGDCSSAAPRRDFLMKPSYYVTRDVDLTPCENRESISFSVQKFRLLQNCGRESRVVVVVVEIPILSF